MPLATPIFLPQPAIALVFGAILVASLAYLWSMFRRAKRKAFWEETKLESRELVEKQGAGTSGNHITYFVTDYTYVVDGVEHDGRVQKAWRGKTIFFDPLCPSRSDITRSAKREWLACLGLFLLAVISGNILFAWLLL